MSRTATVSRKTRETNITVTLDLDGSGKADLHTGIGFFDHMLDGFARHGLFDLTVQPAARNCTARARIESETPGRLLSAFHTVILETERASAISCMVGLLMKESLRFLSL